MTEKLKSNNEGCRLYGHVQVNKVAGNIHIAPGKSFQQHHMHVHDINALGNVAQYCFLSLLTRTFLLALQVQHGAHRSQILFWHRLP